MVKVSYYYSRVALVFISLFLVTCSENNLIEPVEDNGQPFVIRPWEYSTNHFFVDTIYADHTLNIFENYYGRKTSVKDSFHYIKDLVLWKLNHGLVSEQEIKANLYSYLPSIKPSQNYPSSMRDTTDWDNPVKVSDVRLIKLIEGKDYIINRYTGVVSILGSLGPEDYLAAAYRMEGPTNSDDDDLIYGDFHTINSQFGSYKYPAILKLIRLPLNYYYFNNKAQIESRKLQLKNIYYLGNKNISQKDFKLDLYFVSDEKKPLNYYNGNSLLKAFGFDKDNDGKFDYNESVSIFSESGEIIFPTLQPFGENLPSIFNSKYRINSVYNDIKENAISDSNSIRFYLTGKYNIQ